MRTSKIIFAAYVWIVHGPLMDYKWLYCYNQVVLLPFYGLHGTIRHNDSKQIHRY